MSDHHDEFNSSLSTKVRFFSRKPTKYFNQLLKTFDEKNLFVAGRARRHSRDKLILSKRFIAFLQKIRKEACAIKKPAKPTFEKEYSQPPKPLPFGLFC